MLVAETKKRLHQNLKDLRLPTVRRCYEEQAGLAEKDSLIYEQYLHEVIELEIETRQQNRVSRFLRELRASTIFHGTSS